MYMVIVDLGSCHVPSGVDTSSGERKEKAGG